MPRHSKRYRELSAKVKTTEPMELTAAIDLLKQFANTKFDQSVETAMRLGIDPRQADQLVRGAISLPAGIGKAVRLAAFARGDNQDAATEAGADIVGAEDLAEKIKGGFLEFDVVLATPDMMGVVGPLGRILGPRKLMPTPKNGTVTSDIANAVKEFKGGKIEYRSDSSGNIHAMVGKLSFAKEQLVDNITAFVSHIRQVRPASVKGTYVHSVTITATMSPGIRVAL